MFRDTSPCDIQYINNITVYTFHFQEGPWCLQPGYNVKQDILNVMSTNKNSFYYTMDTQIGDEQKVSYYHCTDLFIGQVLNVYGRSVVLFSCDECTKSFYRNVYRLGECTQQIKI